MKMSDKRKEAVYSAISDPIMKQRIDIQKHGSPDSGVLDSRLFCLQNEIWEKVHSALNLEGPA